MDDREPVKKLSFVKTPLTGAEKRRAKLEARRLRRRAWRREQRRKRHLEDGSPDDS